MADEHEVVSLRCPKCAYNGARPYIGSATVLTVRCASCDHEWSLETNSLAPDIRVVVKAVLEATTPHS